MQELNCLERIFYERKIIPISVELVYKLFLLHERYRLLVCKIINEL